jgi:hypothetical protein
VGKINARSETDLIEPAKPPSKEKKWNTAQQTFAREIGPPNSEIKRAYCSYPDKMRTRLAWWRV